MHNKAIQNITNQFITAIEKGTINGTWQRPWQVGLNGMPHNPVSDKPFTGTNALILLMSGGGHWATYKQWKTIGAQVEKGERSTSVLRPVIIKDKDNPELSKLIGFQGYSVFSADQVSGYTPETFEKPSIDFIDQDNVEQFVGATKATIEHDPNGASGAFYSPSKDLINMPEKPLFHSPTDYYSTLLHELAHWSGHKSRLDRELNTSRFGDEAYGFEELIAEFTSTFLCAHLGVHQGFRDNHAKYLKSWLRVLKNDSKALTAAASKAEQAYKFICKFSETSAKEKAKVA
jgi:antirestriction protein ArdC